MVQQREVQRKVGWGLKGERGGFRPCNVTLTKGNIRLGTHVMLCDVM